MFRADLFQKLLARLDENLECGMHDTNAEMGGFRNGGNERNEKRRGQFSVAERSQDPAPGNLEAFP
jgi:hypothetical protein